LAFLDYCCIVYDINIKKEYDMRILMITITSAFLAISLMSCKPGKKQDSKPAVNASVFFYVGKVTINGKEVTKTGEKINFGDVIATGKNGICKIKVNDKAIVQLKKNSELVFRVSQKEAVLHLKKGWLAGITKKPFNESREYKIKTPTVLAAVRGTSYCIKVENSDSSYFCVCNGTINLAAKDSKNGEDVKAAHHKARRFKKAKDGSIKVEKAKMLYHGDKGIEALAKDIHEKINWNKAD
jgi:hypothetical protein